MKAKMISFDWPVEIQQLAKHFQSHGFDLWVVGGALRNIYLDRPILDWDFATQATPTQMMGILPHANDASSDFGCIMVPSPFGTLQITTCRSESMYEDHRRPHQVTFTDCIEADLARRDFTCNAMAYHLIDDTWIDPFGGGDDLSQNLLNPVGDPELRFQEDALRMLRAVRFQSQYGLNLSASILEAIDKYQNNIQYLSKERIYAEWTRFLTGDFVNQGLGTLKRYQNLFGLPIVYDPQAYIIDTIPPFEQWRMLYLYQDKLTALSSKVARLWVGYGFSKKYTKVMTRVADLIESHPKNELSPSTKVQWIKLLIPLESKHELLGVLKKMGSDVLVSMLSEFFSIHPNFSFSNLPMSTHEMVEIAHIIEEGPAIGFFLDQLYQWMVEHPYKIERQYIEKWIRETYNPNHDIARA